MCMAWEKNIFLQCVYFILCMNIKDDDDCVLELGFAGFETCWIFFRIISDVEVDILLLIGDIGEFLCTLLSFLCDGL